MAEPLHGRCHCGNLSLRFEPDRPHAELPVRSCTCTFCSTRRARWTSDPVGQIELSVADESQLSRYRFGTNTAEFLVCARCGIHIAATSEIDGSLYAVVNIDCIEALRADPPPGRDISFDGEDVTDRLARRKRSWTPARWV